ncbi:MAG: cysteine--tRNA ligase, partial [Deinococcus-Thermus bacterium]|nr:cysteine--tRNA ligase [Deinococcota bacterium]
MPIKLTNTLSGRKETFEPLDPDHVRLYVCGPTVYDFAHIGNGRAAVVFDVLYRLLRHTYGAGHVTYVRNITDVDDKIIAAHRRSGEPIAAITARYTDAYHADMDALGCLRPDVEPRATAHIEQMVALIARLLDTGHAYAAEGHVLFHVPADPNYGVLSHRSRDDMVAGARVEVAPYKRDPADFVLWKPAAEDEPGWDSPWGRGRPGWHLECSAMSKQHLGDVFDIHGGGQDLIFPHHENEIAQSTCAHGKPEMARYWVHNGYLMAEGEKMSKSLGNFYTVHDLKQEFPGEALRLTLLSAHYRQPLDFTKDAVRSAKAALDRLYTALRNAGIDPADAADDPPLDVAAALDDDLNTPMAISHLHELAGRINKAASAEERRTHGRALAAAGALLGLLGAAPDAWLKGAAEPADGLAAAAIEAQIAARAAARRNRDFAEADRI